MPYFLFLSLIGVPMMYMEMSISQYFQMGNIKLWAEVNHYMKGIGYGKLDTKFKFGTNWWGIIFSKLKKF